MKGSKSGFVCFLLLFLVFIFSATASRDFSWMESGVAVQEMHFQGETGMTGSGEGIESDGLTTRRIDLESMDYGGTGPNDRHNPPSPGRV
ncbi:hypothetical protein L2E82_12581 [Cichorium intybus]|uniref:Uncharacterized protein n=1 Tax=Cichorium intybus TaxID=13427 RepID=A0ACB9GHQ7_CICIN|nr:hypothetical protein L2E82_12581 [Cichorium intybus]